MSIFTSPNIFIQYKNTNYIGKVTINKYPIILDKLDLIKHGIDHKGDKYIFIPVFEKDLGYVNDKFCYKLDYITPTKSMVKYICCMFEWDYKIIINGKIYKRKEAEPLDDYLHRLKLDLHNASIKAMMTNI